MSTIILGHNDNFSIVTTATYKQPWGDYRAQIQIKTPAADFDLIASTTAQLNIILDALNKLLDDLNDEKIEADQIRCRVFNSNNVPPIIRKPLFVRNRNSNNDLFQRDYLTRSAASPGDGADV